MLVYIILVVTLIGGVFSFQTGAPPNACGNMVPGHGDFTPQTTPSPYALLVDNTSNESDGDNFKYNVTITSSITFGGFLLMSSSGNQNYIGQFLSMPTLARKAECGAGATNNDTISAVTHTSDVAKQNYVFEWEPDMDFCGDIVFVMTVARTFTEFWVNVRSSPVNIPCPSTTPAYNNAASFQLHMWTLCLLILIAIFCTNK